MTAVVSKHIQITPGICGGKPRIAGHRIRVQDVVLWYGHLNLSPDDIVDRYPSITLADVHAALAYYYDHLEAIRQDIHNSNLLAEHLASQAPSILQRKLNEQHVNPDSVSP